MSGVKPFRLLAEARAIATGRELAETARRAEGIGIDTLVIPDHLIPQLAPIPAMATIAAATEHMAFRSIPRRSARRASRRRSRS